MRIGKRVTWSETVIAASFTVSDASNSILRLENGRDRGFARAESGFTCGLGAFTPSQENDAR